MFGFVRIAGRKAHRSRLLFVASMAVLSLVEAVFLGSLAVALHSLMVALRSLVASLVGTVPARSD